MTTKTQTPETIAWTGRPDITHYLMLHFLGIITVISGVALLFIEDVHYGYGLATIGIGLWIVLYAWLARKTRIYTITDKRVTLRDGILSRSTSEVRLKDIQLVNVKQCFSDRLFNVGTIEIASAGHAGIELQLFGVSKPVQVRDIIRTLMDD